MNDQFQQLISNLPIWAQQPAALIGAGVVLALLLVWLLIRLTRRRDRDEDLAKPVYGEELPARPITPPPPPVAPPPLSEVPFAPPAVEVAPTPAPAPMPEAAEPAPEPGPSSSYVPDEAPAPAAIADEPIAAAAPFDASPASLAADVPEAAPAPVASPEAVLEPAAREAPAADELTRMKGVGPRLAERLNSVGVTSFAQIAALTPAEADALDAKLGDFQGRIHRDRWIEQAGYLAKGDVAGFEATFGKL